MTTFTRIFDDVAERDACFQLLNRSSERLQTASGAFVDNPHHGPVEAGQFFQIERTEYEYFLEVLPPLAMTGGAFAMCEYKTGDLTDGFFDIAGRFFCATLRIPEGAGGVDQETAAFEALREARAAIACEMAARVFA